MTDTGGESAHKPVKRHRRVVAPPTNGRADASATPDADWSAHFAQRDGESGEPMDDAAARPRVSHRSENAERRLDERDRWFMDERPPQWS